MQGIDTYNILSQEVTQIIIGVFTKKIQRRTSYIDKSEFGGVGTSLTYIHS